MVFVLWLVFGLVVAPDLGIVMVCAVMGALGCFWYWSCASSECGRRSCSCVWSWYGGCSVLAIVFGFVVFTILRASPSAAGPLANWMT